MYCQKAILFLNAELELLKLRVSLSKSSFTEIPQPKKTRIYFIPKSRGLGIIGLAEMTLYLKLSGEFINEQGKTASLKSIKEAFETIFNFEFKDFDRKIHEVFKRKPFNLTKALDYLRNLLIREKRSREEQKIKNNAFIDI